MQYNDRTPGLDTGEMQRHPASGDAWSCGWRIGGGGLGVVARR